MQLEREKKYRIDNFDCSILDEFGIAPLHFNQYYLKFSDSVKDAINYYHGPIVKMMAEEARIRVIEGENIETTYEFTVKSGGNLVRKESEVLLTRDVAENLIKNHAKSKVEKERYIYSSGMHVVEINRFLDRNLILAEIEYDGDVFTEEDIDKEIRNVIGEIDEHATLIDVTYDSNYKNKNLAISIKNIDSVIEDENTK